MEHHDLQKTLNTWQRVALAVGVVAAAPCILAARQHNEHFMHFYLIAFLFWTGVSVGSLALLCLHTLVDGRWGFLIQRPLESAARTLPLMALLFVPIALNLGDLYKWVHPTGELAEVVELKKLFLNEHAFICRTAFYFIVWIGMAYALSHWSRKLNQHPGDNALVHKMRVLGGAGVLVYALTASLAAVDWLMSLEPAWWSTMEGPLFMVGQGLATLSFMAILANRLSHYKPFNGIATHQHFHDIGNLMFAFTILWAYMNIAQYIIIWSGNLPKEDIFYLKRLGGGWPMVTLVLALFHFFVPFLLLLNKPIKRHSRYLARVGALVILMRFVDLYWQTIPTFHDAVVFHWLLIAVPVAVGGIWLTLFLQIFKNHPFLADGHPRFAALHPQYHGGHE